MEFLNSIFGGGGDPTASPSGRSVFTPSGQSQPGVFDPFGFAGRLMGMPTEAERVGSVQGEALKTLAELQAQGMQPHEALLKFMSDPRGQKWFATDPQLMDTLTKFKNATTPPTPHLTTASPGSDVYETAPGRSGKIGSVPLTPAQLQPRPNLVTVGRPGGGHDVLDPAMRDEYGRPRVVHRVEGRITSGPGNQTTDEFGNPISGTPTTEIQNFKFYGDLSGAPASRLRELAELAITPDKQRPDREEMAIDDMVRNRIIDADVAMKLKAKVLQVKEVKNAFGESTGRYQIVDMTGQPVPVCRTCTGAQLGTPRTPGEGATMRSGVRTQVRGQDTMFLGAGMNSSLLDTAASVMGTVISPDFQTAGTRANRERIQAIRSVNTALAGLAADTGTMGIPKEMLHDWKALAPQEGVFSGPPNQAVTNGIQLYYMIQREKELREEIMSDESGMYSNDQKKAANKTYVQLQRLERSLPPIRQMEALEEALIRGTAGTSGANTAREIGGMIVNGLTGRPAGPQTPAQGTGEQTPEQRASAIRSMSAGDLSTYDWNNASPAELQAGRDRIQALRNGQKRGPGSPKQDAGSDTPPAPRNRASEAPRAPTQEVLAGWRALEQGMISGKVTQDTDEVVKGRLQPSPYKRKIRNSVGR